MEQIVLVVHLLTALAIIGLILLQQGKGAEMGASFGAGASQTLFGSDGSGNVLTRATAWLVLVFFVTSGDSAVLVLGMMSSGGNPNPSTKTKLMWGGLIAGMAISLLLAGGLKALQTATIVFAVPFSLVIILMASTKATTAAPASAGSTIFSHRTRPLCRRAAPKTSSPLILAGS